MQNKKSREKTQINGTSKRFGESAQKVKERLACFQEKNANQWA
jgi:hypothetical protein